MFQGTHFRSSTTKTTQTTTLPSDTKAASSYQPAQNACLSEPSSAWIQTKCLRRLLIALTTIRLGSTSTSTTVSTTTSAGSLSTLLKSVLLGCYYIIAFTSLLVLILYINRFASQNLHQSKAHGQGGLMLASSWPGMLAILSSSAEMAASTISEQHQSGPNCSNRNGSRSNANLIRTKRSLTRDGYNNNSSSISSQANHSTSSSQSLALATGEQQLGKTSVAKANQRNKLLFRTTTNSSASLTGSNWQRQQQQRKMNLNVQSGDQSAKEELELESTFELQRRAPARITGNFNQREQLDAKRTPNPSSGLPARMELTERQASYSPNNRGTIGQNSSNLAPLQRAPVMRSHASQWIPILSAPVERPSRLAMPVTKPARPVAPSLAPASTVGALESSPIYRQTENSPSVGDQVAPLLITAPSGPRHQAYYDNNLQPHNYHHGHPAHRHRPNRHWRRPRLNIPQPDRGASRPANKMYKRVLLCDKTLVSLDYVKHGHRLPFEAHFELDGNDFDDNIIDLDSNLDQIFTSLDNRRAANTTITLAANAPPVIHVAESSTPEELVVEVKRRSYLNDDDPLVKCDMWDLEKGLKNRKPPLEILQMAIKADFDTVRDAINRCRQLSERTLPPDDEYRDGIVEIMSTEDLVSLFSMKRGLLPGTKWCGLGDQASSYNDLGPKHRIDICCRAHDHCPIRLKPFRNDYGILNIGLYTKSHCDCDADFYRCLREAHSRTADMLGNLYFNVMKLQCMREERMKVCREMKPIALGFERCIKYEESPVKTVFKFTTPPVAY